jgi:hypothetical protein
MARVRQRLGGGGCWGRAGRWGAAPPAVGGGGGPREQRGPLPQNHPPTQLSTHPNPHPQSSRGRQLLGVHDYAALHEVVGHLAAALLVKPRLLERARATRRQRCVGRGRGGSGAGSGAGGAGLGKAATAGGVAGGPRGAPARRAAAARRARRRFRRSPAQRRGRAEHEVRLGAEAVEYPRKLDGDVAVGVGVCGGLRRIALRGG